MASSWIQVSFHEITPFRSTHRLFCLWKKNDQQSSNLWHSPAHRDRLRCMDSVRTLLDANLFLTLGFSVPFMSSMGTYDCICGNRKDTTNPMYIVILDILRRDHFFQGRHTSVSSISVAAKFILAMCMCVIVHDFKEILFLFVVVILTLL